MPDADEPLAAHDYMLESERDEQEAGEESYESVVSTDLVRVYLREIGKTALLSAPEEVDLAKRIEAGLFAGKIIDYAQSGSVVSEDTAELAPTMDRVLDGSGSSPKQTLRDLQAVKRDGEQALDHMVRANLRLVVSQAKRYTGRGLSFLDLIQEGNVGMMHAVEKFDYTKGFKFSTYATWWIKQSISRAIGDRARLIRLPVHLHEKIVKQGRIVRELEQTGQTVTDEMIAEAMGGITVEKVREYRDLARDPVSLDQPVSSGTSGRLYNESYVGDFIADKVTPSAEAEHHLTEMQDAIGGLLTLLPNDRLRLIITLRHGLDGEKPRTLDAIGEQIGLTRERVRQLEKIAMKSLQAHATNKGMHDLLQ